jgi:hypothetical protein
MFGSALLEAPSGSACIPQAGLTHCGVARIARSRGAEPSPGDETLTSRQEKTPVEPKIVIPAVAKRRAGTQ